MDIEERLNSIAEHFSMLKRGDARRHQWCDKSLIILQTIQVFRLDGPRRAAQALSAHHPSCSTQTGLVGTIKPVPTLQSGPWAAVTMINFRGNCQIDGMGCAGGSAVAPFIVWAMPSIARYFLHLILRLLFIAARNVTADLTSIAQFRSRRAGWFTQAVP